MAATIGSVMRHCRNYFEAGSYDGTITIKGGDLTSIALPGGRYIAIHGSAYNDGVHLLGDEKDVLKDEVFTGRVWLLAPPASFLALCDEISEYDEKNPSGSMRSETFGEYSYTRSGSENGDFGWKTAFSSQLADYQRLTSEVMA